LQGRAARDAVENFADGLQAELPKPSPNEEATSPETFLLEFARDAMAVEFQVLLNAQEHEHAPESAVLALDLVERLEAQLTVYRDSSAVSRLNKIAFGSPVTVEPQLFALLQLGQKLAQTTAGAYDMTSGPLSKLWGFYRRQGRMPDEAEISATLVRVGYRKLHLDDSNLSVRFESAGMEINLGGIGKGYALDRMAELLRADGVDNFMLHGGQSSVLAAGSRSGAAPRGWSVGLAHPLKPGERLFEFRLQNQALGTSGSGTQFFHHGGKRYGHILDPRTGRPAEGVLSSTVLAPSAAEADALSTAFYVGGLELAEGYCQHDHRISALLVTQRPDASLELHRFNLSSPAPLEISDVDRPPSRQ
jgi:thiamine biosynthesis lipoprotein